jgi:hypothetical protein
VSRWVCCTGSLREPVLPVSRPVESFLILLPAVTDQCNVYIARPISSSRHTPHVRTGSCQKKRQSLTNSIANTIATAPKRDIRQSGPILDYLWFPSASAYNPPTFCFVASVRDCPVKLLDASNGRVGQTHSSSSILLNFVFCNS